MEHPQKTSPKKRRGPPSRAAVLRWVLAAIACSGVLAYFPSVCSAVFLALLVLNLVAGFQVLGTLMAVGLMMLPAVAARCWVRTLPGLLLMAGISGIFCAWLGLSLSWAVSLPAGPSIVLTASALFFISVLFGTRSRLADSLRALF